MRLDIFVCSCLMNYRKSKINSNSLSYYWSWCNYVVRLPMHRSVWLEFDLKVLYLTRWISIRCYKIYILNIQNFQLLALDARSDFLSLTFGWVIQLNLNDASPNRTISECVCACGCAVTVIICRLFSVLVVFEEEIIFCHVCRRWFIQVPFISEM